MKCNLQLHIKSNLITDGRTLRTDVDGVAAILKLTAERAPAYRGFAHVPAVFGARAASCRATARPLPPIRTLIPTEPKESER